MSKIGSRIAIGAGVFVVLAAIVAVVVLGQLGRLIERGVETAGPKLTGTAVSLGSARVSIFSGEGALSRLHIGNPEGYTSGEAFDLGEIAVAIDTASLTGKVVKIRSIVIDAPRLVAEFDAGGRNNLSRILDNVRGAARRGGAKSGGDEAGGTQTRMIIEEFRFQNGEVQALAPAFGVDETVKLPPIVLKNLGAKQGGAAASDLTAQIMRPIVEAAVQAATQKYLAAQRGKLEDKAKEKLLEKVFQ